MPIGLTDWHYAHKAHDAHALVSISMVGF